MDEYDLLGVARDASPEDIKAAFRRQARELHPDRHTRTDGTVPDEATRAFLELGEAMRRALAVRSVVDATAFQHARGAPNRDRRRAHQPTPPGIPVQRRRSAMGRTPTTEDDPMLVLLTLPQRCARPWSDEALETWALTVVPAARSHLADARRTAELAGAVTRRQRTVATVHVLLTRTLRGRTTRRYASLADRLAPAYATLEQELPAAVVERLPARVDHVGPRTWTTFLAAAAGATAGGLAVWVGAAGLPPG